MCDVAARVTAASSSSRLSISEPPGATAEQAVEEYAPEKVDSTVVVGVVVKSPTPLEFRCLPARVAQNSSSIGRADPLNATRGLLVALRQHLLDLF